jgi:hypothetical protein
LERGFPPRVDRHTPRQRYAKGGDNSELKNWAGKTLPALKHHQQMAQELGKAPSVGQSKPSVGQSKK